MLIFPGVDATETVDHPLDGAQEGGEECRFAGEQASHEGTEWFGQRNDDDAEQADLEEAVGSHGITGGSEFFRPDDRKGHVAEEQHDGRPAKEQIKDHLQPASDMGAGPGV